MSSDQEQREQPTRDFKGIWLPRELWLIPRTLLSWTERLLWAEINSLCVGDQGCWASNEYLAQFLGVGEQTVRNSVSRLKRFGLIVGGTFNGRRRILHTMPQILPTLLDPRVRTLGDHKKIYGQTIKKFMGVNNSTSLGTPYGVLAAHPDRVCEAPEVKTSRESSRAATKQLLEQWNDLPGTRAHRKPESKVYKLSRERLKQLSAGQLINFPFDQQWLQRMRIDKRTLRRNWTKAEISENLKWLALLFNDAYWPAQKTHLPRDLPSLIYNPKTQRSWFLAVGAYGVRTLAEIKQSARRSRRTETETQFHDSLAEAIATARGSALSTSEKDGLERALKYILHAHRFFLKDPDSLYTYLIPDATALCTQFSEFIEDRYGGTQQFKVEWVSGCAWKEFLRGLVVDE